MPELPEVEFTARHLRRWGSGRRVVALEAEDAKPLRDIDPATLRDALVGQRLGEVVRHGKQMVWHLTNDRALLLHLGMTGKLLRHTTEAPPRPHTRVQLYLDDGHRIDFIDTRRFGRLRLLPTAEAQPGHPDAHPELARLGPDALVLTSTPTDFLARIHAKRQAIKVALMNQSLLAGVGNIYATEALFSVGISPKVACCALSEAALEALATALHRVMQESLDREQADEIDYITDGGQNPFTVYGRAHEPCPTCATPIERFIQQGRATFWCPRCQGH